MSFAKSRIAAQTGRLSSMQQLTERLTDYKMLIEQRNERIRQRDIAEATASMETAYERLNDVDSLLNMPDDIKTKITAVGMASAGRLNDELGIPTAWNTPDPIPGAIADTVVKMRTDPTWRQMSPIDRYRYLIQRFGGHYHKIHNRFLDEQQMQGATTPVMAPKAGEEGQPLPEQPQASGAMLAVPDMNAGRSREEVEAEELFGKDYDPPVPFAKQAAEWDKQMDVYAGAKRPIPMAAQEMHWRSGLPIGKTRPFTDANGDPLMEDDGKTPKFDPKQWSESIAGAAISPEVSIAAFNLMTRVDEPSQDVVAKQVGLPEGTRITPIATPGQEYSHQDKRAGMGLDALKVLSKQYEDELAERAARGMGAANDPRNLYLNQQLDDIYGRIRGYIQPAPAEAPTGELPPATDIKTDGKGNYVVTTTDGKKIITPVEGPVSSQPPSRGSTPAMTVKEERQEERADRREDRLGEDDDDEKSDKYGRDKDAIAAALSSTERSQAGNLRFTTAAILHGPQRVRGVLGAKNDEQSKWWEGVVGGKSRRLTKAGRARIEEINRTEAEKHGQKYTPKKPKGNVNPESIAKRYIPQKNHGSISELKKVIEEARKEGMKPGELGPRFRKVVVGMGAIPDAADSLFKIYMTQYYYPKGGK